MSSTPSTASSRTAHRLRPLRGVRSARARRDRPTPCRRRPRRRRVPPARVHLVQAFLSPGAVVSPHPPARRRGSVVASVDDPTCSGGIGGLSCGAVARPGPRLRRPRVPDRLRRVARRRRGARASPGRPHRSGDLRRRGVGGLHRARRGERRRARRRVGLGAPARRVGGRRDRRRGDLSRRRWAHDRAVRRGLDDVPVRAGSRDLGRRLPRLQPLAGRLLQRDPRAARRRRARHRRRHRRHRARSREPARPRHLRRDPAPEQRRRESALQPLALRAVVGGVRGTLAAGAHPHRLDTELRRLHRLTRHLHHRDHLVRASLVLAAGLVGRVRAPPRVCGW